MKKTAFILIFTSLVCSFSQAQSGQVFLEKTSVDLGKVVDFKASIVSSKNLADNSMLTTLLLENKNSGEVQTIEFSKNEVNTLIGAMNQINANYLNTARKTNVEISTLIKEGFEIGSSFEVAVEKAPAAGATKKEKYYIETKEKYYEGKIVNTDQSGTYIWKEVSATSATKEVVGKWNPFVRTLTVSSRVTSNLSAEEFKEMLKFLEENVTKM